MRRPRPAYAHQAAGARICASLWAGGVLEPRDAEVLAEVTRDAVPGARVPATPLGQCAALAAVGGHPWRQQVDAWATLASLGQLVDMNASPSMPSGMGPGPAAKRPRILTPLGDAAQREAALAPYEEVFPGELQSAIMRYLIGADPRTAIALGGASASQAALLMDEAERAARRRAQRTAGARQEASAGEDYVRARAAFGGDPRDAPLATALCLMEAFARFLFETDREQKSLAERADVPVVAARHPRGGLARRPTVDTAASWWTLSRRTPVSAAFVIGCARGTNGLKRLCAREASP
ncbi:hypothetical protein pneo_cds_446 [Pandoravirus neocaledonia]|uniref:Uncharacterized protein n=1 Tax=Pandoravirus neocaledonia TaxID=2107708 RepID=A0A2U7UC96_9VIRU|nr:hypothetical protein pneo_cds_446 [Pandoravirus neocaledonia]AVK76053.1 hypothetical protein pneo_cds_446 [Pandoravirus neocaledonia]